MISSLTMPLHIRNRRIEWCTETHKIPSWYKRISFKNFTSEYFIWSEGYWRNISIEWCLRATKKYHNTRSQSKTVIYFTTINKYHKFSVETTVRKVLYATRNLEDNRSFDLLRFHLIHELQSIIFLFKRNCLFGFIYI